MDASEIYRLAQLLERAGVAGAYHTTLFGGLDKNNTRITIELRDYFGEDNPARYRMVAIYPSGDMLSGPLQPTAKEAVEAFGWSESN